MWRDEDVKVELVGALGEEEFRAQVSKQTRETVDKIKAKGVAEALPRHKQAQQDGFRLMLQILLMPVAAVLLAWGARVFVWAWEWGWSWP